MPPVTFDQLFAAFLTFIIILGLFVLAYCSLRDVTISEMIEDLWDMFKSKAVEVKEGTTGRIME